MKDVHIGFVCKGSVGSTHPFSTDGSIQCKYCTCIRVLEVRCSYYVHDREPSSAPYAQDDETHILTMPVDGFFQDLVETTVHTHL